MTAPDYLQALSTFNMDLYSFAPAELTLISASIMHMLTIATTNILMNLNEISKLSILSFKVY